MADNKTVRAPYNFVPFSNKVLLPYLSPDELPAHDSLRPDLKTGEIHVSLRAETPVFVSDGGKTADRKQDPHFFRLPNGGFAIPGSTVRGMVRENMQILGFGLIRSGEDLADERVLFRDVASSSKSKSVSENAKKYYQTVLNTQSRRSPESGKTWSFPANVHAGYLFRSRDGYMIRPTKGPYLRVSRRHPDVAALGEIYATVIPVSYTASYTAGEETVKTISVQGTAPQGTRKGMLLYTGKAVGKPNHLYLFPEPDFDAPEIALSKEDALIYQTDLEGRKNALKGLRSRQDIQRTRGEKEWLSFWELPQKEGECKPVFYIRHDGHVYFGMSPFLRIGYPHSTVEGLPRRHRELAADPKAPLDFPHAILGFAEKESAYRSRVSFGDFPAEPGAKESAAVSMVLGNPRPSYYPGYLRDGKDYTQDDFLLRGYKQYWFKEVPPSEVAEGKERVESTLRPLPKGTAFHGVIRFKNLNEEELGLLLWALRLEEGCFQAIGMGKPYGYGRMKLTIESLKILNCEALYGIDFGAGVWTEETGHISDFIRQYDAYAAEKLYIKKPKKNPSITSQEEIQDFFFMKRSIRPGKETDYMAVEVYRDVRTPLPTVEDLRRQETPIPKPSAAGNDPWAQLKNFKGRI